MSQFQAWNSIIDKGVKTEQVAEGIDQAKGKV